MKKNPRKIVVGDIHGALKALEQLVDLLNLSEGDQLIFMGDYVDGWSQSAQVIDFLINFEKLHSSIFLRGNHDDWCESWLKKAKADKEWLMHGGKATISSYADYTQAQRSIHLAFFENLQNYFVDDSNRLFIHAGFSSMHGPAKEYYESNCYWDRTLWEMALTFDNRIDTESTIYPKRLSLFHEIYIGHTPTLNYGLTVPMNAANVWNIDTGAAFTGRLTAMDIDTKECWQTDVVQNLYPNEKGRNG